MLAEQPKVTVLKGWRLKSAKVAGNRLTAVEIVNRKTGETQSLEGRLFHPALLARLGEAPWGYIRFMDWGQTNASPLQDWSDRRRPLRLVRAPVLPAPTPRIPMLVVPTTAGSNMMVPLVLVI